MSSLTATLRQGYRESLSNFRLGTLDRRYANSEKCDEPLEIAGILSHGQEHRSSVQAQEHNGEYAHEHARRGLYG